MIYTMHGWLEESHIVKNSQNTLFKLPWLSENDNNYHKYVLLIKHEKQITMIIFLDA